MRDAVFVLLLQGAGAALVALAPDPALGYGLGGTLYMVGLGMLAWRTRD